MKRFLVFAFEDYYPNGGWNDFSDACDSIEEAKSLVENLRDRKAQRLQNAQIVDTQTGEILQTGLPEIIWEKWDA